MNVFQFSGTLNSIRYLPVPIGILVLSIFDDHSVLKQHPDYQEAKAGNFHSALNLISDLAWGAIEKTAFDLTKAIYLFLRLPEKLLATMPYRKYWLKCLHSYVRQPLTKTLCKSQRYTILVPIPCSASFSDLNLKVLFR